MNPDDTLNTKPNCCEEGCANPKGVMGLALAFDATHPWTLKRHDQQWYLWDGTKYVKLGQERVTSEVFKWMYGLNTFTPTVSIVNGTVKALMSVCDTPIWAEMPCFIGHGEFPAPESIVAFSNGLLDLDRLRLLPHTPDWLSTNSLPHPYDPDALCPEWDRFLLQVFQGDQELVQSLSQWFGYCLTRDIRQHKFAMFVGPPRSGKSTTLNVLTAMLGRENVTTPTLTSLGNRLFALETFVGKMAAIIADAHLDGSWRSLNILEQLKSIVGGDSRNVQRRHRTELSNVGLTARVTIAANEPPQLPDTSSALLSRMLVIPFNVSFVGREDRELSDRLAAELPGITNWSLRGLMGLRETGRLVQPKGGEDLLEEFATLGSPIKEFLNDRCEESPEAMVLRDEIFAAYTDWCKQTGHKITDRSRFGAMLRAAIPNLDKKKRGRNETGNQILYYLGVKVRSKSMTNV